MIYNPIPERFLSTTKMIKDIPTDLQNIICEYHSSYHNWDKFYTPLVESNFPFIREVIDFMIDEDCSNWEQTPMDNILEILEEVDLEPKLDMIKGHFEQRCMVFDDEGDLDCEFTWKRKHIVDCFVHLLEYGYDDDLPYSFNCFQDEDNVNNLRTHCEIEFEDYTDSSMRVQRKITFKKITESFLIVFISQLFVNSWENFYNSNLKSIDKFAMFIEESIYQN